MRFSKYANIDVSYAKRYFIAKSENILHTYSVTLKILSTLFLYITTMNLAQDQLIDILIRLIDLTLFI